MVCAAGVVRVYSQKVQL